MGNLKECPFCKGCAEVTIWSQKGTIMDDIINGAELMIQLVIDFDVFLTEESDKLNYDKDELQALIKQILT